MIVAVQVARSLAEGNQGIDFHFCTFRQLLSLPAGVGGLEGQHDTIDVGEVAEFKEQNVCFQRLGMPALDLRN